MASDQLNAPALGVRRWQLDKGSTLVHEVSVASVSAKLPVPQGRGTKKGGGKVDTIILSSLGVLLLGLVFIGLWLRRIANKLEEISRRSEPCFFEPVTTSGIPRRRKNEH